MGESCGEVPYLGASPHTTRKLHPMSEGRPSWLVPVLVLVIGTFVAVLDVTIVNVAIPTIQNDFGITTSDAQWITTAYALTMGVLVPASGWLADRFGLRRVYIAALLGFAATSVLCGLAWDLPSLVVFRVLQAIPGGILPVVTLAMVYKIVPPKEIGAALGTFGLGVVLAPAVGPTLGGFLVEYLDWRLIFFSNVPIGVLGALAARRVLTEFPRLPATRFDGWGFAAIGTGLFALLLAFTKAPDWGWSSYRVCLLIVGGLACLAVFVVVELGSDAPLLDVRLFARWPFTNSLLLLAALSVGMFAVLFYIPLFLQDVQAITPVRAGLIMLPEAIVMGVLAPISGLLYDRFGPRWPVTIGLAIAAYGTYLMCGLTPQTPESDIIVWTCIRGVGNALAMMAIIAAGLAAVPAPKINEASAISNMAQRITSALGLALLVGLVASSQAQLMADRAGLLNAATLPEITGPGSTGLGVEDPENVAAVAGLLTVLQQQVTATAYANMFLVATLVTAAGVGLALLLRVAPAVASAPAPTEPVPAPAPADPAPARAVPGRTPAVVGGGNGPPTERMWRTPRVPADAVGAGPTRREGHL